MYYARHVLCKLIRFKDFYRPSIYSVLMESFLLVAFVFFYLIFHLLFTHFRIRTSVRVFQNGWCVCTCIFWYLFFIVLLILWKWWDRYFWLIFNEAHEINGTLYRLVVFYVDLKTNEWDVVVNFGHGINIESFGR